MVGNNVKVIDLSADFRFTNPSDYKNIYGKEHQDKVNLKSAIYGISELNRNNIKNAHLIANPGCYVITSVLALIPILKSPYIDKDQKIHISAINGTSGAGSKPKAEIMHIAVNNNILPYSLDGHRHCPELEIQLSKIAQRDIKVVFSTAHGSFVRGIYSQISVTVDDKYRHKINRNILIDIYKNILGLEDLVANKDTFHSKLTSQYALDVAKKHYMPRYDESYYCVTDNELKLIDDTPW